MIINGARSSRITIYDKVSQQPIAVIADDDIQYINSVQIILDPPQAELGEASIVNIGDYLYYESTPEELFVVSEANSRFFIMYKVSLGANNNLEVDSNAWRKLTNNKYIATLEELGLRCVKDDNHIPEEGANNG